MRMVILAMNCIALVVTYLPMLDGLEFGQEMLSSFCLEMKVPTAFPWLIRPDICE